MVGVTVALCTWNNATRLSDALKTLCLCVVPGGVNWELVIVNNNCTDATDEVVDEYRDKLPIVYVREPKQGLSNARNAGLRHARGELIVFTDDDVKPCENWIVEYWRAYEDQPEGRFWGGPVESEFEGGEPDAALLSHAPSSVRGLDWGSEPRALKDGEGFLAANWACPRKALDAVGGFNPDLGLDPSRSNVMVGEETELMGRLRRAGWEPYYLPKAKLRHLVPASKVSREHIAQRKRAMGRAVIQQRPDALAHHRSLFGVPVWLYRRSAEHWLGWTLSRLRGRPSVGHYMKLQSTLGWIDAAKAIRAQRRNGA